MKKSLITGINWQGGSYMLELLFAKWDEVPGLQFYNHLQRRGCPVNDLAFLVKRIVAFGGELIFDTAKHDDTSRKLLDFMSLSGTGSCRRKK